MTTTATEKRFDTKIDIDASARADLMKLLNQQMADNADLHSQTKQAHWNVKGIHFLQLHKLFDEVAEMIQPFTDDLAERVTALGGYATGTVRMAAANSNLPEYPVAATEGDAHLRAVRDRWAAYAASTRDASRKAADLGDPTSEDLFIEISRDVDKGLYFIESHLQG
jgi:starvation-inducible DNA-binding protein